jgi:streptogramin lyase
MALREAASPGNGLGQNTRTHRRRARWIACAVLIAGALVAAIAPQFGSKSRPSSPTGNLLALVSPDNGRPTAIVPLRAAPTDVALGFGSLWVTEPDIGAVVRIDIGRRAAIATIPVGTRPSRIIAVAGHVWVLDPVDRSLSRIDPSTETVD